MKNIDSKTIDVHKEELATDEEKFCRMVWEILEMDAVAPKIDKVKINQLFKKRAGKDYEYERFNKRSYRERD